MTDDLEFRRQLQVLRRMIDAAYGVAKQGRPDLATGMTLDEVGRLVKRFPDRRAEVFQTLEDHARAKVGGYAWALAMQRTAEEE